MCVRVSVCPTPGGLRVAKCVPVGVQQNVCVYMFFSVCVCVCVCVCVALKSWNAQSKVIPVRTYLYSSVCACVCNLGTLECTKQSHTCAYVSTFICVLACVG
jgi:hypothetical protein